MNVATNLELKGVLPALVTPLAADTVDTVALRGLVEWYLSEGVHGVVPCGTTGEATALTAAEWDAVVRTTIEAAAGRVPVIAGVGGNNTRLCVEKARRARELGADGVLAVVPYYVKPTQDGMVAHFEAVAGAGLPVVLYNVPGRTGAGLQPATVARLAAVPGVVGLKEASGDLGLAAHIFAALPEERRGRFALLSGDDATMLPLWALGGRGVITVVGDVAPRQTVRLWESFVAGELAAARRLATGLLPLIDALFVEGNPIPVKAALAMMGRIPGDIRLPLTPAAAATRERLTAALADLGLLERP
jgi:4-hydroxy-tetrahydrodipicolinate synthase